MSEGEKVLTTQIPESCRESCRENYMHQRYFWKKEMYYTGSGMQFQGKVKYQLFHLTIVVIDAYRKKTLNLQLIYKIYF